MKRGLVAQRRKPVAFMKLAPRNDCRSWKKKEFGVLVFRYKEIRDLGKKKKLEKDQGNWDSLAWK